MLFVTLFDVERRNQDFLFGDYSGDEGAGGDVECGVVDRAVLGGDLDSVGMGEFGWVSFFDGDEIAGGESGVEG